jgi:hypothetical protein
MYLKHHTRKKRGCELHTKKTGTIGHGQAGTFRGDFGPVLLVLGEKLVHVGQAAVGYDALDAHAKVLVELALEELRRIYADTKLFWGVFDFLKMESWKYAVVFTSLFWLPLRDCSAHMQITLLGFSGASSISLKNGV